MSNEQLKSKFFEYKTAEIRVYLTNSMRHFFKKISLFHPALKLVISSFFFLLLIGNWTLLIETGNWYQQFMPNLNGRQIVDLIFTDSLRGYAITNEVSDTSFILRTTNGGDNWFFSHFDRGTASYYNIQFVNQNTGFVSGYIYDGSLFKIVKTTNAGSSWFYINSAFDVVAIDMFALNQDTIWLADPGSLVGGVFRTINGGSSWQNQLFLGSQNPVKIYMYNGRIGYIAKNTGSSYIMKTTDSGLNWTPLVNGRGFSDMFFVDSLTGWTAFDSVRKTTNGGLNWQTQILPYGGIISNFSQMIKFCFSNRDTAWGVGGYVVYPNNQVRGFVYRTINGGNNWLFQIPDTAIHIAQYYYIKFVNKLNGWAYTTTPTGVHTNAGGNSVWITGIKQISSEIPKQFKLYQNYPNPFNPKTIIKYQISNAGKSQKSKVKMIIHDITGKEVTRLVDENQSAGTYEVDFSGTGYSSGVYFYSLIINEDVIDTKKMILLK